MCGRVCSSNCVDFFMYEDVNLGIEGAGVGGGHMGVPRQPLSICTHRGLHSLGTCTYTGKGVRCHIVAFKG